VLFEAVIVEVPEIWFALEELFPLSESVETVAKGE
jgi:hypothetical protein